MADLDPSAAAFLDRLAAGGATPAHAAGVDGARAAHLASAATLAGPGPELATVADTDADGVPVRIYRPQVSGPSALVVYLHGAGWVAGTLDTYDTLCRLLADRSGATVVSAGYRLAPEHRWPAQPDDAWSVLQWAQANAAVLGAGSAGIVVAGDSAGGTLAALTAGRVRDEGHSLAGQVLIYPILDATISQPSTLENSEGFYLTLADLRWYWDQYLPPACDRRDPGVSPFHAADLADLPPALVLTAGFDPLRDEGVDYADRLAAAGVPVERLPFPGQIHGFVRCTALIPEALDALDRVGAFIRRVASSEDRV
jgi:acetyl esterase